MADVLTKAGRYEVVRELGRGSMGIVYQGFDPIIGRTVAIKTMLTEGLSPEEYKEFRARFQREAQAAGVLSHPNIVNVFDYGEDNGVLYLIMEFLEGTSLEKLVEGKKVLPIETIIPMCEQVCGALDHAHQRGIVHRDIKPANIMILNNGMAKVTDFGIAKMVSMGMTQAGLVLGTPNYMSPEQVKGRQVDGRSDIFSLGVILYDLVTGEKPFPGQNITTVIYKIINENPVPPRELDATIHPGLSFVICKALAKSPQERYQTCRELAEDLKNYRQLGGQATPASATMILKALPVPEAAVQQRPAQPAERRPAPPAVPVQRTQVEPPQPASPAPAPVQIVAPPPSHQKPRTSPLVWVLITLLGVAILGIVGGYYYLQNAKNNRPAANLPSGQTTSAATNLPSPTSGTPSTLPAEKPAASGGKTKANEAAPVNLPPASSGTKAGANPVNAASGGESAASSRPSTKVETPPLSATGTESPAASLPAAGGTAASAVPSGGSGPTAAPKPGQLMVNSNVPGAKFTIDGSSDPGWVTPSTVSQPPGNHRVVISKEGYGEYEQTVDLEAGRTATVYAQLSQQVGEIVINTTPPGLEVFLDGKSLGPSPAHAVVPAGTHKYTVKRPGWEPYEGSVNVRNGAAMSIRVNMDQ